MIRVAFDTNILAYLAGVIRAEADEAKVGAVRDLVDRLSETAVLVAPVQALGELFVVLRRAMPTDEARTLVLEIAAAFDTPPSSASTALAALDLVVDHKLQFWDALIATAAAEAGCALLVSEDMQDGFVVRGVTIVNPLAERMHWKLAALVEQPA